jgi:hypothetical protein
MNDGLTPLNGMPARGVDIIEGIPVFLKGDIIFAFKPEGGAEMRLGTYNSVSKKPTWNNDGLDIWLKEFRGSLTPRTRALK